MEFDRIVKGAGTRYSSICKEVQQADQLISDILHELDPRNHIVGLARKRKVDSREAMVLGLRLKAAVMHRRDLKDEMEFLRVVRQQIDEKSVGNVKKFVEEGKNRKYARRITNENT